MEGQDRGQDQYQQEGQDLDQDQYQQEDLEQEQKPNHMSIGEIEELVKKWDTKLSKIKEIAKLLNIKVTKLKKDEIKKLILSKIYDPVRYFNELYDVEEKYLKDKEQREKSGKDYWLHKFTKYNVEDKRFLLIVRLHPHQVDDDGFTYIISLQDIHYINELDAKSSMYNIKLIKTEADIKVIKNLCNEKHLKFKEFSRETLTSLDRVCRIDLIEEIVGYGRLCMQSRPCCHSFCYVGTDDKTYNIKYAGYRFIRDVYLKICDGDESELPEHFMKKK